MPSCVKRSENPEGLNEDRPLAGYRGNRSATVNNDLMPFSFIHELG